MQFLIANSFTDSLYFAPHVRHPHGNFRGVGVQQNLSSPDQ